MQQAVSRKIKGIDLDFHLISGVHETDVMVADHGFNFERAVAWDDDHQGLGGGHHATDRVYGQLLHYARDRRGQLLQFGALFRFGKIRGQAG